MLAYIRLPDKTILNEQIITKGFGYADLRFRHSRYDKFMQLQNQAIKDKTGLWKKAKRSQLPKWLQRERPMLLK